MVESIWITIDLSIGVIVIRTTKMTTPIHLSAASFVKLLIFLNEIKSLNHNSKTWIGVNYKYTSIQNLRTCFDEYSQIE